MTDKNQMSIIGFAGIGHHRSIRVKKVENGFVIEADVQKPTEGGQTMRMKDTYVCHSVPEVLHIVKNYLESKAEDLKK